MSTHFWLARRCAAAVLTFALAAPGLLMAAPEPTLAPKEAPPEAAANSGASAASDRPIPAIPPAPRDDQPQAKPADAPPTSARRKPARLAPPATDSQESTVTITDQKPGAQPVPAGTVPKEASPPPITNAPAEPSDAPTADEGRQLVMQAYGRTKSAKTEADYSAIIDLCQQGLRAPLNKDSGQYGRQLEAWAFNRRGELYSEAGDQEAAMADFQEAITLDPNNWRAVHNRGVNLAMLGSYEEAIADFNRTIQLHPKYSNAFFNRAELLYELGEFSRAVQDYTEALRLAPRDVAALNSRGHAYYRLEKFREALQDYSEAIRLEPNNAVAYTNRGDAYVDLGYYEQATMDYRTAIKLDSKLGRAYQSAAWLMATCPADKFRNPKLAVEAAARAIELDGDEDPRYLETLAAAQASAGDFTAAEITQQKLLQIAPKHDYSRQEERLQLYQRKQPYRESPRVVATRPVPRSRAQ